MSILLVLTTASALGAGAPVACENLEGAGHTLAAAERFDLAKLPAGEFVCKHVDEGKNTVRRLLVGSLGDSEFLLDLSSASGGVPGAAVPGQANGVQTDWYLACSYDATTDRQTCLLQQQALTVFRVNGMPYVQIGQDHQTKSEVAFRVDDSEPIIVDSWDIENWPSKKSVAQLSRGKLLRLRYTAIKTGVHDSSISLRGFEAAHELAAIMDTAYLR